MSWYPRLILAGVTLASSALPAQRRPTPGDSPRLEFKMISSGANRPGVAIWEPTNERILLALHGGTGIERLADSLGLPRRAVMAAIDSLRGDGVLVEREGALHPSCMVITREEGEALGALAHEVALTAIPGIRRALAASRARMAALRAVRHLEFDDWSFFLASDVLLDNWQINKVEREWLHAERPLRSKSRYYCAVMVADRPVGEAFGIYGNQVTGLTPNRAAAVYGNTRGGTLDLTALPVERLAALAGARADARRPALLGLVLDQVQAWVRDPDGYVPSPALRDGLTQLGLVRRGRPVVAVVDTAEWRALDAIAAAYTPDLVQVLAAATPRLRAHWQGTRWGKEITFEEYAIWWYHFFYTALTDRLAAEGAIRVPASGLFHYVIVE